MAVTNTVEEFIAHGLQLGEVLAQVKAEYGWSDEEVAAAERRYRDFLYVCYRAINDAPHRFGEVSWTADQVWHEHMESAAYEQDCAKIFGPDHTLSHQAFHGNEVAAARATAHMAYQQAGREYPADDQRAECVWSIVSSI